MSYYPEFARMINQELQRRDRSASWLAQRLGVSPSTVGRWLNEGTRPGDSAVVVQIAGILGMAAQQQTLLVAAGYGYAPVPPDEVGAVATPATVVQATTAHVGIPRLPVPVTPLVGRTTEIGQLAAWLAHPAQRLVTIVGPGGIGKTRLALAVAQAEADAAHFADGVAFADLAPLSEVDQLPASIAQAVGLPLESGSDPGRSAEQQVVDFLRSRHLLLVLDNAEHLLHGTALVATIVDAAQSVKLLVTSRAPLRLHGEQLFPLQGLDVALAELGSDAVSAPAATLFMQAARRVRPDYAAAGDEVQNVAAICQMVEGMPLAIELAAAWVTIMSAAEILAAIRQSLRFLETDLRGVPERHRSMEAVFDATWQRLREPERQLFAQLSVFRGGFTQDAVTRVTGAELGQLRTLAASSLIVYNHARNRYNIHELLRQYGALRLADAPEVEASTHAAHSQVYFDLLRRRQYSLKNRGLQTDLQIIDVEFDNLARAWNWAATAGDVAGLGDTLDGFGLYLQWRGRADEGELAFRTAAAALGHTGVWQHQLRALAWQAHFARLLGQNDRTTQLLHQSHQILNTPALAAADLRSEQAFVLMQMGAAAAGRDREAAQRYYLDSLALFEALDERWFAAEVLLGLGHVCLTQGDFVGQRTYVQRALDTYRTLGNVRGVASALSMLADIDSYRGQPMSGLKLGIESLAAFRSLGDPAGVATCLSRLGMTYMNLGDVTNARQVVNESVALFREMGLRRDEVIAYAFRCAIELMAGDYGQAEAHAARAVAIATHLEDLFVLGVAVGFLGWAQHYNGNLSGALKTLREAVTINLQAGATMDLTRTYAELGFAQWKNGQAQQARTHCYQSLRLSAQTADAWSLLTAISSSLAILADGENPVRALELYSMLQQDPLCAASRWFEDGIGPHVTAARHALPTDVVDAALKRGALLDPRAEAAKMAEEVAELGWGS